MEVKKINHRNHVSEETLTEVKKAIESVQYGSVTVLIQDGKVIQIDITKKVRL